MPRDVSPLALLSHALRMVTVGILNRRSSIDPRWRKKLKTPLYCASSFAYSAVGLLSLLQWTACAAAAPEMPLAYALSEAVLVTLQGGWSYWSDVLRVGEPSWAHPVDRASAVSLCAVQVLKFCVILPAHLSARQRVWVVGGIGGALACKVRGYHAILANDVHSYRRSHILWHLSLPLVIGALNAWRWRDAHREGRCVPAW